MIRSTWCQRQCLADTLCWSLVWREESVLDRKWCMHSLRSRPSSFTLPIPHCSWQQIQDSCTAHILAPIPLMTVWSWSHKSSFAYSMDKKAGTYMLMRLIGLSDVRRRRVRSLSVSFLRGSVILWIEFLIAKTAQCFLVLLSPFPCQ